MDNIAVDDLAKNGVLLWECETERLMSALMSFWKSLILRILTNMVQCRWKCESSCCKSWKICHYRTAKQETAFDYNKWTVDCCLKTGTLLTQHWIIARKLIFTSTEVVAMKKQLNCIAPSRMLLKTVLSGHWIVARKLALFLLVIGLWLENWDSIILT